LFLPKLLSTDLMSKAFEADRYVYLSHEVVGVILGPPRVLGALFTDFSTPVAKLNFAF
jgi:hypothetical protein